MRITLQNIAFNYDPTLSATGSFFLRRNETQIVPIPEWSNTCSSDPACAPAAYIISKLPATLTIKASFLCDDHSVTAVHIQAIEIPLGSRHILGPAVTPMLNPVTFQNRKSDLVVFELPQAKARIEAAGVSKTDIAWQWQFSTDGTSWTNFQQTYHRIYTVIDVPQCPWKPNSNSTTEIHVPWTAVLDKACEWAAGAKHVDVAAEGVTRNMYRLGEQKRVRYVDGLGVYAHDKFDCTKFLQVLTQGFSIGQAVSCHDCATVVSTFSNILGAKLYQSDMGFVFNTNPVLLIGSDPNDWRCSHFGTHEVAWKKDFDANAAVFDACVQVDGDDHPEASDPHHTALQPTNVVFGTGQFNSYKFRLFASGQCEPLFTSQCRSLGPSPNGLPMITNVSFLDKLKDHYDFNSWDDRSELKAAPFDISSILDLVELGDAFAGWEKLNVTQYQEEGFPLIVEGLIKRSGSFQEFVQITLYDVGPGEKPTEFLLQLLGHFELLNFGRLRDLIGDVAFVTPEGVTVLFKRKNFVVAVRSVGILNTRVVPMAEALDRALQKNKPTDLSTKTRRNEMQEKAEVAGHPLATKWHCFDLLLGGLIPKGEMDLSNMANDGALTNGTHTHDAMTERLTGKAVLVVSPLGDLTYWLNLTSGTIVYNGLLLPDNPDRPGRSTIVGGFRVVPQTAESPHAAASRDVMLQAQNEGVWVVTKP